MNNLPIVENTFIIYGLYPIIPADLKMILWYLNPIADEYFAKEKILLTKEGVIVYQQSNQLRITIPSDVTMGVPSSIILPRLQDKSPKGPWTSEKKKVSFQSRPPRHDLEGPTRIQASFSESVGNDYSAVIKCLTEENRGLCAMRIASALYQLSEKVSAKLDSLVETTLINV